jgi:hypothetical protein
MYRIKKVVIKICSNDEVYVVQYAKEQEDILSLNNSNF